LKEVGERLVTADSGKDVNINGLNWVSSA
jgi:hypothetical protein